MRRTNTCGELRSSDIGKKVCLEGWVRFSRDHGGVAFIDLADRYGITQVVFDPEDLPAGADSEGIQKTMATFSRESCVLIEGTVRARVEGTAVETNPTGEIEVLITHAELLSKSKLPPFEIGDQKEGVLPDEDTRMKYRYLDLRRTDMIRTMEFRSKLVHLARVYLESKGFLEIETPILGRSTPEGARDYIIPSRVHPGTFYALPQSPQQFKQMLMVGGMDRYYQVARCFRDEDSRKDRQPEFTQLDIEMSFVDSKDIQDMIEGMVAYMWKGLYGTELKTPFPHIGYRDAMERFGSDKPDMRYGLEFVKLTDVVRDVPYKIFQSILAENGIVAGICIKKEMGEVGRNEVDRYIQYAKKVGLGGLTWMRCENGVLTSNITKYFTPEILENIKKTMGAEEGDLVFLIAGPWKATYEGGGFLRKKIAEDLGLVPENEFMFFWMDQNPMFEIDPVSGKRDAFHHPFVLPTGDLDDPECGGACFDLCLNGNELGSGSERIHDAETQIEVFHKLGLSDEKIQARFDYFVEALSYGAPPHGGIAIGIDRLVAILLNKDTIREVIAFPKNKKAVSLLDGSPSPVDDEKLQELQIISLAGDDLDISDAEEFNPDNL
ncbi:Aspartyl-tRNA synthetase [Candidatus Methanomethylophilus alvi Mx1201]|jgi:aspartyl-tRNA synthetase|uniref:Aspartate--tRNA(Asp/Asn) ligase n=2 Tax=Methanomethylophilus alvi TaxID=1291540 RepID=M9SJ90_METAX|nr:aspartate--tRNA ligase [Methanomethylophilus alvi]CDF30312.1 aspartate--tRNA ligase [Methanoculleus sp. CAG:1088]AGI86168.1 Aspartyl-tRNA synthetase [Candidatus Methanomethylophilus alvi Mx1201]AYQ55540.1 aspartate--tRNA ligase [Methanomethylophilus alvi]MCI5973684.1 aspartate--tRNA ligase [Methanomethylophilus alvi]MDD7480153.1 aspartate--tRNA ligase [Methanomethylophilus alvi]